MEIFTTKLVGEVVMDTYQYIPQLLEELAPGGYENCNQFKIFHLPLEIQYKIYEEKYIHDKRWSRKFDRTIPMLTFDEFKETIRPVIVNTELEMKLLLVECFMRISQNGIFVKKTTLQPDVKYPLETLKRMYWQRIYKACGLELTKDESFAIKVKMIQAKMYGINIEKGLLPAYRLIFNSLKSKGFDWSYRCMHIKIYESSLPEIEEYLEIKKYQDPLLKSLEEKNNNDKKSQIEKDNLVELKAYYDQTKRTIRHWVDSEVLGIPPDKIMAYFDVYGVFPDGYPSEIKDY